MISHSHSITKSLGRILLIPCATSLILSGSSCQRKIYIPVETVKVISDSTAAVTRIADYTDVRDSITVIMTGDTLIRDRVRTVIKNRLHTDTLIREHRDTIRIEIPVMPEPAKKSRYPDFKNFKAGLLSGLVITAIICALIRIRKRYRAR